MLQKPKRINEFHGLIELVQALRGPGGCPWDKEQTPRTLAPYAIEEVYEMVDALEKGDDESLKEELGDVLFQVALHAQMAEERAAFKFEDVFQTLIEKMIRRHPHVFSETKVKNSEEVWLNWEKIKAQEKNKEKSSSLFSSIPSQLPSLQRAYKIGIKTEKLKFDWPNLEGVFEKFQEELSELNAEIPEAHYKQKQVLNSEQLNRLEHEMGDVLFSLVQIARHLDLEPEQCLRKTCIRFESRFEKMMDITKQESLDWSQLSNSQKESLWEKAKNLVSKATS
ncbi:MAG: nucleoside triphosphate pyrophosphohydrolase [Bdellovibrionota bacterium]